MNIIYNEIEKRYFKGDIIYLANYHNYKISLEELKKINIFTPNSNFINHIIINELSEIDNKTYKELYIIDIGEQIWEKNKFGDLLLINDEISHKFSIIHSSRLYNSFLSLIQIKKILKNINDFDSFSRNYKLIRNYLYSCNDYFYDIGENGLKLIQKKLNRIINSNSENGLYTFYDSKYKILKWRFNCGTAKEISPKAADKSSK